MRVNYLACSKNVFHLFCLVFLITVSLLSLSLVENHFQRKFSVFMVLHLAFWPSNRQISAIYWLNMVDNCCGLEYSEEVYFYELLKKISNCFFSSDNALFLLLFVISAFVLLYSSFHRAPVHLVSDPVSF